MIESKLRREKSSCCKDEYPVLKKSIHSGAIYLLTSERSGFRVFADPESDLVLGEYSSTWDSGMVDYIGEVVLFNK